MVDVHTKRVQASGAGRQRQTQGDLGTQSHGTRTTESAGLPKPTGGPAVRPSGFAASLPVIVAAAFRLGLIAVIALAGLASFHH